MFSLTTNYIIGYFYLFIFVYVFFTLYLTITVKNPINAVLYLILVFFGLSSLFVFCGADYLGVLFLLIYAGAISILLLFVIMLLDLRETIVKKEQFIFFLNFVIILFFIFLFFNLFTSVITELIIFYPRIFYVDWLEVLFLKNNIEAIGIALYGFYNFQFILLGLLLFLVMVLVITLVINFKLLTKKQSLNNQIFNEKIFFISNN